MPLQQYITKFVWAQLWTIGTNSKATFNDCNLHYLHYLIEVTKYRSLKKCESMKSVNPFNVFCWIPISNLYCQFSKLYVNFVSLQFVIYFTVDKNSNLTSYKCHTIKVFLNTLPIWQFVRKLQNRFTGEWPGYFRYLCVVCWLVNAFTHQNMTDFFYKISKICIYRFIWQSSDHHTQLWQVGNWANVI